jgi:sugar phosphate isomerase/epimerase
MKLACQEQLIPGDDLIQKWEFITRAGFEGIELQGFDNFRFRARLDELKTAGKAGVVMPSVCVISDHFIGDFDAERRRDAVENMKSLLSVIGEVGGHGAITPAAWGMFSRRLPPFEPPRSEAEDCAVLLEGLHELGEHAGREGVTVFLEPLNRYEDHMVNSLAQAISLVDEVAMPSVRIMGDLFHMNIEEDDIPASIRGAGDRLAHVHLADSNRAHPGSGHTDFRAAFDALRSIGFSGYMAMESGIRGDPEEVLPEVGRLLGPLAA